MVGEEWFFKGVLAGLCYEVEVDFEIISTEECAGMQGLAPDFGSPQVVLVDGN